MPETYLEKALVKLARQLNAYDEASLISLWEQYAEKVRMFEPTKRWEEAALVFGLIQSVRFKNQLFNNNWSRSRRPDETDDRLGFLELTAPEPAKSSRKAESSETPEEPTAERKKGKLLQLSPRKQD